jgi:hypothetical protein
MQGGLDNLVHIFTLWGSLNDHIRDQLGIDQDGLQDILEFMRQDTRQLGQGLNPLGLYALGRTPMPVFFFSATLHCIVVPFRRRFLSPAAP